MLSVRTVMQLTLFCAIVYAQLRQPNIIRCATADAPTSSPAHTEVARQLSPTSDACLPQRRHAHSNRAHVRNIMRRQHIERAEAPDSTSADGHNTAQDSADHTRSAIKAPCTACTPSTPAFVRKAYALLIALSRAAYRGSRMRAIRMQKRNPSASGSRTRAHARNAHHTQTTHPPQAAAPAHMRTMRILAAHSAQKHPHRVQAFSISGASSPRHTSSPSAKPPRARMHNSNPSDSGAPARAPLNRRIPPPRAQTHAGCRPARQRSGRWPT